MQTIDGAVAMDSEAKTFKLHTKGDGRVFVHPSSVLFSESHYRQPYVAYLSKSRGGQPGNERVYLRDVSLVSPYAVLLMARRLDVQAERHEILVDGWMRIKASPKLAVFVRAFRDQLDRVLAQKYEKPSSNAGASKALDAVVRLLSHEVAAN